MIDNKKKASNKFEALLRIYKYCTEMQVFTSS